MRTFSPKRTSDPLPDSCNPHCSVQCWGVGHGPEATQRAWFAALDRRVYFVKPTHRNAGGTPMPRAIIPAGRLFQYPKQALSTMLDPVFTFVEKLIEQFSWKRLLFVILLLCLLMSGLIVFESYTGYFRLAKINKSVDIIIKASSIPQDTSQQSKEILANATKGISKDIDDFTSGNSTPFSINKDLLKIISALFPWLFFSIVLPLHDITGTKQALGGIIFIALPSAVIGYFLPSFEKEWINYLVYPFLYFIISILLVQKFNAKISS